MTEAEISAMIDSAPSAIDKALLACLYDSGARRAELLSTTIADANSMHIGVCCGAEKEKQAIDLQD